MTRKIYFRPKTAPETPKYTEELPKTHKELYHEYLMTKTWKDIRKRVLKRDERRCRLCNSHKKLRVHHRSYPKIFGEESLNDLITLCENCHSLFHDNNYIKTKKNKQKKVKKKKISSIYEKPYVRELSWIV
jgi:5-methylcytosine-specific restriction endonuclease McrA